MALDLEEQEQVAALRAWWRDHGGRVVMVVAAVAIAFSAWQGWSWYHASRSSEASTLYESLVRAVQEGDAKAVRDAGGALSEGHPKHLYAAMGALVSARFHADRGDAKSAKAQLQWVIERADAPDLRDIARLRLAALLLDEQAHDQALKTLETAPGAAFEAQYAALRGDIYHAMNKHEDAKTAYRSALDKAGRAEQALVDAIQMRLDALGG